MSRLSVLLTSEDWWAVWAGMFLVLLAYVTTAGQWPLDFLKQAIPAPWPAKPIGASLAAGWPAYVAVYALLLAITATGVRVMGGRLRHYVIAFTLLFVGSFGVLVIGSQSTLKTYGLEYPFWALIIGLLIGNTVNLPGWFRVGAGRTEFYIKTGIVLLGASLPFTIVLQGGLWGFLEALIIVVAGFTTAFVVARRLGFDNEFAAVLGAGGSVCGVSAAIAMGSSVKAQQKQVGYVVSLVVLYALALIFILPLLARLLDLGQVVTGAWIGGSELADAAGLAAAAMVGETAVKAFTLVKLNRDIMIGVLAFVFATVAVTRWQRQPAGAGNAGSVAARGAATTAAQGTSAASRPSAMIIWERFPKFVLAFLLVSFFVTSLVLMWGQPAVNAHITGVLNVFRTWLFTVAFLCIGLNTRLADVRAMGARPIIAFTAVVLVNLLLGFVLSHLFFGGIIAAPLG